MRSNQLSYPAMTLRQNFVEIEGLEPSLTEPESVVLPLHHISIWLPFLILGLQKYKCFIKIQNFLQKIHVKRTNSGLFVLLTCFLGVKRTKYPLFCAFDGTFDRTFDGASDVSYSLSM